MASFPSLRIEGGLLGPDLFDQLLAGELQGQKPADFGLDGRRNLTSELAALFADARAYWGAFQHRLERLPESDAATTATRDGWIIPLLGLLGYELQLNRRAYEVDGLTFAVSHRAGEAEDPLPVHVVGARHELGRLPPSGRPRLAPHSLVQEYLNRTEQVWGLVTNGKGLRLLRNSTLRSSAGLCGVRPRGHAGGTALRRLRGPLSPVAPHAFAAHRRTYRRMPARSLLRPFA